ncbi:MAG: type VI secretion system tip protein TssI/VgrG [Pseudomonadota bacterium]
MSDKPVALEGRQVRLKHELGKDKAFLLRAQVDEGLSMLTETVIEFTSSDEKLDLADIVGKEMSVEIDAPKDKVRHFAGHCVSAEYLGRYLGAGYYRADLRPWFWFLTRTSDCRVFQEASVIDIIKEVFKDLGFSDFKDETSGSFKKREYCVMYRETYFDFLSRLMEEEGIYYYFTYKAGGGESPAKHTLHLVNDVSKHKTLLDHAKIDFHFREEEGYRRTDDHCYEWRGSERIQSGKVTLTDYDFEKPSSDLKAVKMLARGKHKHKTYELYDYPGHHLVSGDGEKRALVRVEAEASKYSRARGVCNVRQMAAGGKFKLDQHPKTSENAEYLVVSARHQLQIETDYEASETIKAILGTTLDFGKANNPDTYRCIFEVQPTKEAFRAPLVTPWPEIPGVQTAVVVGKKGEEIQTDKYGRVMIQFHWDRLGKKDEKSSCFVRCAVPWSGKNWGMISVPRIGQEVVVQFENGDPDRPIITGMLYNGETLPPYALPANMTQTGIKTNKSKKGGGFNELVFEDKEKKEFVRFQSERDYEQIIKNNAKITIGAEHKDKGDLTITVQNDKTETITEGNHTFKVAKGEEKVEIAKDRTATVKGGDNLKVTKNKTDKVTGAYNITCSKAVTVKATSKITLKCGNSKIEISPTGIKIAALKVDIASKAAGSFKSNGKLDLEGAMANMKGKGMLKIEGGGLTQIKSSGILMGKGSLTMIN